MDWNKELFPLEWSQEISNYEEKLIVAKKIAALAKEGDVIGFGSGSTSFLATQEIAKRVKNEGLHIAAIPTSNEIGLICTSLGIPVVTLNQAKPDWGFDGADEVSPDNWLVKGRGGAMFNEKLIMSNSPKTYIIVDQSKFVSRICEKFPIPVECVPAAYKSVTENLYKIGATNVHLRLSGKAKDGPVITENGNYILDSMFNDASELLEKNIKSIVGVVESGLFINYNITIIGPGME
jgi:ribose 5-phosphate isomerase A